MPHRVIFNQDMFSNLKYASKFQPVENGNEYVGGKRNDHAVADKYHPVLCAEHDHLSRRPQKSDSRHETGEQW